MGNLGSIKNMIVRAGGQAVISSLPSVILDATKIILPGVGSFDEGMKNLKSRGLLDVLNQAVLQDKKPVLGICLGAQLMTKGSEEGAIPGLGWVDAETVRFQFDSTSGFKVPHMGWNLVEAQCPNPLFAGLEKSSRFYFVHSFHMRCSNPENILTKSHYGYEFASGITKDNVAGVQFHPEKSHRFGLQLMRNFVGLNVV